MKKLLSTLLCILLVLTLMPTIAFADSDFAHPETGIHITKNTSQNELDTWAGEGALKIETVDDVTIVTLLKDIKMGHLGNNKEKARTPINFGRYPDTQDDKMILDLNGHLIASDTMVINCNCNLTIKDSGTTGKIFMDTSDSSKSAFEAVANQRILTIEGGTFEVKIHPSLTQVGAVGSAVKDVKTVIKGGKFIGPSALNFKSGETTISGGEFQGSTYGILSKNTSKVIFPADSTAKVTSSSFPIVIGKSSDNTGNVIIDGGYFNSTGSTQLVGKTGEANIAKALKISGGTFGVNPASYVDSEAVGSINDVFYVGELAIQNAAKDEATKIIDIKKGNVDLTELKDGIKVINSGDGDVTANGNLVSDFVVICNHVWKEKEWTLSDDYKEATLTLVCEKNNKHVITQTIPTTITEVKPTCSKPGERKYTAKVVFEGKEYSKSFTSVIAATDKHSYVDGKCTICGKANPQADKADEEKIPTTGDTSNIMLLLLIMASASIGAITYRRKSM